MSSTRDRCVEDRRDEDAALAEIPRLLRVGFTGFRHREFRDHVAQLQSRAPDTYSAGVMTYDLRRLRLHGLIERAPRSHRYRITPTGAQVAMFYARLYTRALRPPARRSRRAPRAPNTPLTALMLPSPPSCRR